MNELLVVVREMKSNTF